MEKRFDKIEEKLDKIGEDLNEIKLTQTEQAKDLKYHIKRTDLIENQLIPLVAAKHKIDGAFKVIGIIATIVGFVIGVAKILFG